MSTGRKVCLSFVVTVAALLLATPTAYGKTRVSASGDVVTITVPIDVQLVGHDPVTDSDRTYFDQLEKLTDKFWWGDKLRELRYRDCLRFELVLDINLLPDSPEAVPRDGAHQIEWWLDDPNVRSTVIDPGTSDPTEDAPTAFRDSLTGQWGYMNIRDFNHELGHLLGLGDDYTGYPDSTPLPGRDGTMMDGGSTVDQALMDRIGKVIEEGGIELPECDEVWEGEVRYAITGHPTIALRFMGSARIAVGADESVDGSMRGRGVVTDFGGPHRFTSTCDIGGRREATSLALELQSCTSSSAAGGFSGAGGSLTLAITGTTARGSFSSFGYDSFEMRLRCVSCEGVG